MKYINFFEFLKDKDGREIPDRVQTYYKRVLIEKEAVRRLKENPNHQFTQNDIDNLVDEKGNLRFLNLALVNFLPDNIKIKGDLDISEAYDVSIKLPNNLTVGGNLNGWDSKLYSIPNNLTVKGNLDVSNDSIEQIGSNLTVGGNLGLSHTTVRRLPNNVTVGGDLIIQHTYLESLPKDLKVGGTLYLNKVPLYDKLSPLYSDDEIKQMIKKSTPGVNNISFKYHTWYGDRD
jgi:hypothetical protein